MESLSVTSICEGCMSQPMGGVPKPSPCVLQATIFGAAWRRGRENSNMFCAGNASRKE